MIESRARVWRKIGCYYALTLVFGNVFNAFVLDAGKVDAGNLLYVTGAMWSPEFATKRLFSESIRELPWWWGEARYVWLGYLTPIANAVPVYFVAWLTGIGGFADAAFVQKTAEQFGWIYFPTWLVLPFFILCTATLGLVGKTSRALGEEIGWRGFLVRELAKVTSFTGVALISGAMWAV